MKESGQTDKPASGLNKYLPQLLIIGMILLVYIQNLWFDFAYLDDNLIVFAEYEKIDSLSKIPQAFASGYLLDNYYRPMIMISFIIDTAIAGQSSTMYHLTNLILHIAVSLMLYTFLLKVSLKKSVSLFLTLFFSLHPINTNAVSWIAGRNDLLLALFSLFSLLAFIAFRKSGKAVFLLISLTAYFFAMMSKEVALIIPMIFFLYDWLLCNEHKKYSIKRIIVIVYYIIPAFIYLYLRIFLSHITTKEEISFKSFTQNIYILFEYFAKIFYFPLIEPIPIKNSFLIILGSVIFLFLLFFLWKLRENKQQQRLFLFGVLFFLILVLPAFFIRVKAEDGEFNYIDCRVYLPLIGFMIALGVMLQSLKIKFNRTVGSLIIFSFLLYTVSFTFIKSNLYSNGKIFWEYETKLHPGRASYWMGYGFYFFDNNEFFEAAKCAETAIMLKPDIAEFYHKAALAYESAGDFLKANDVLERSLEIDKDNPVTIVNLIKNYLKLKQTDKADIWSEKFLGLNTGDKKKLEDLSSSISYYYTQARQYNSAVKFMKQALEIFPDNPVLNNDLGALYVNTDSLDSAKIYFEKAVDLDPDNISFHKNLNLVLNKLK
ncbi:MAG: tetratricopeptide repeat protein [Ignavibacterium sp.]|jgi:tetratricopeptide (TPR) repeat protein|nr:MAG: tetratricopeptide repeat protein [Ignavibacterium sp.]MDX9713753.1 tetratricopeptide repeat protein [Ignavibacteriaceae bacterium]